MCAYHCHHTTHAHAHAHIHTNTLVYYDYFYFLIRTCDGYETTWQVNVLAPFLLTSKLIPCVEKSEMRRVIMVSSISQSSSLDFSNLQQEKGYSAHNAYSISKLADAMIAYELAERLESKGITVNTLDPGTVNTKMLLEGWGRMFACYMKLRFITCGIYHVWSRPVCALACSRLHMINKDGKRSISEGSADFLCLSCKVFCVWAHAWRPCTYLYVPRLLAVGNTTSFYSCVFYLPLQSLKVHVAYPSKMRMTSFGLRPAVMWKA